MPQSEQRSAVLVEARRWIGTPYHHMGRLRGVGADCATFPAEVYAAAGVIAPVAIEFYPPDWHLHRGPRDLAGTAGTGEKTHERYLARVLEHAVEVPAPLPGDMALWRVGRAFAHGAIVLGWPRIVHAVVGIGVMEDDGTSPTLALGRRRGSDARREVRFFSPWCPPSPSR
jgi:cell wall-associated NlpC family hydrolase